MAIGLTVIVKLAGVPAHKPFKGVTMMVAVTGAVPLFRAVKEFIFPVPLDGKPIEGVLLVQL